MTTTAAVEYLQNASGVFQPSVPVTHCDEHYESSAFDTLLDMQERHFWYRGRHRFLHHAVHHQLCGKGQNSAVDLGGGCGGWLKYLSSHGDELCSELALADSSIRALEMAGEVLPSAIARYQIDLMDLHWHDRWDAAFLLDVIEHLPDDVAAMQQARDALKPGGLLFVTTPALKFFWSYNDDVAHHLRRYSKADYAKLARQSGLKLLDARYFMFLLSPLLWLSRFAAPVKDASDEEKRAYATRAHAVPSAAINQLLSATFATESPLGHWLSFPWGTSILGVFQKPE
jgi:SAM-dependent methyltransferase